MRRLSLLLALVLSIAAPIGVPAFQAAKPEEVGLSSERLARIGPALTRQIEERSFPGAVALVARKGRIAYFESVGQLDPKTGAPMSKDAIFRLYSMTKPFTSVAVMMLVEDGRTVYRPMSRAASSKRSAACRSAAFSKAGCSGRSG